MMKFSGILVPGVQMLTLEFQVPGKPCAKERPRLGKFRGKTIAFTPEKTVQGEQLVGLFANRAFSQLTRADRQVWMTAVRYEVHIRISYAPPKKLKAAYPGKQDVDNVLKLIMDGLQRAQLIMDDTTVTDASTSKRWATALVSEGVQVRVVAHPD